MTFCGLRNEIVMFYCFDYLEKVELILSVNFKFF